MSNGLPKHVADYLARRGLKPQAIPQDVLDTLATLSRAEVDALEKVGASLQKANVAEAFYPLLIH